MGDPSREVDDRLGAKVEDRDGARARGSGCDELDDSEASSSTSESERTSNSSSSSSYISAASWLEEAHLFNDTFDLSESTVEHCVKVFTSGQ